MRMRLCGASWKIGQKCIQERQWPPSQSLWKSCASPGSSTWGNLCLARLHPLSQWLWGRWAANLGKRLFQTPHHGQRFRSKGNRWPRVSARSSSSQATSRCSRPGPTAFFTCPRGVSVFFSDKVSLANCRSSGLFLGAGSVFLADLPLSSDEGEVSRKSSSRLACFSVLEKGSKGLLKGFPGGGSLKCCHPTGRKLLQAFAGLFLRGLDN